MQETRAAQAQIREAGERFIAQWARATDAQWRFRAAPEQRSIADVAEHVAISTANIGRLLAARLLASPLGDRRAAVTDVEIPYLFYRGDEPPDVAAPTGAFDDPAAGNEAVGAAVRSVVDWAAATRADLRAVGVAHPVFGVLDGVQWLLFVAAHIERHRAQVIGIAGRPGFSG